MKYPTLNESTFSNEFDEIPKVLQFEKVYVRISRILHDGISVFKKKRGCPELVAHIYSDKTIVFYTNPSFVETVEVTYISENYDLVLSNIKNKLYENH